MEDAVFPCRFIYSPRICSHPGRACRAACGRWPRLCAAARLAGEPRGPRAMRGRAPRRRPGRLCPAVLLGRGGHVRLPAGFLCPRWQGQRHRQRPGKWVGRDPGGLDHPRILAGGKGLVSEAKSSEADVAPAASVRPQPRSGRVLERAVPLVTGKGLRGNTASESHTEACAVNVFSASPQLLKELS